MTCSARTCAIPKCITRTISVAHCVLFVGRRCGRVADLRVLRSDSLLPLRIGVRQIFAPVAIPRVSGPSLLAELIERVALNAVAIAEKWLVRFDLIKPRPDRR